MKGTIIILTLVLLFNFAPKPKESSGIELFQETDLNTRLENKKVVFETSIDSLWNHLVYVTGGCLTGGEYVDKRGFGGEGCVMSNSKDWDNFFNQDEKEITTFLIEKISDDTIKTKIHTCPFFGAIEGEVAVYSLQKIYDINWFDFDEFKEYKNRETESSIENRQAWLQGILKDEKKREILVNCWIKKASG